jgi:hypothetical protein
MAIKTQCSHCNQPYTLDEAMAGKRVRCKSCGEAFLVQTAAAEMAAEVVPLDDEPPPRRDRGRDDDRRPYRDGRDYDRHRPDRDRDYDDRDPPRRRRSGGGIPVWAWLAGGGALLVLVLGVILIFLFTLGPLGNRVTAANYARLQPGMTEAQVIAILGTPSEVADPNDPLGNNPFGVRLGNIFNIRVLTWRHGNSQILVTFTNNSLTMSNALNLR